MDALRSRWPIAPPSAPASKASGRPLGSEDRESAVQPVSRRRSGQAWDTTSTAITDAARIRCRNRTHWNLFDGGRGPCRMRQQANVVNQAIDLRDKGLPGYAPGGSDRPTTMRSSLPISWANWAAIPRPSSARADAFASNYDIGQRSLLDVLNSENETYTARRRWPMRSTTARWPMRATLPR